VAHLQRFLEAQASAYDQALSKLVQGQKESHGMWFILPQLKALGKSDAAKFFGISDLVEARSYQGNRVWVSVVELKSLAMEFRHRR
jgi:uncharacterized protein (DUF1810 family)